MSSTAPSRQRGGFFHWLARHAPGGGASDPHDVQTLLIARIASKLGLATLSYGGMVHLAREGANEFEVVLVGASGYVAALLFGLQGGVIADTLSKRLSLSLGYALQAALCFLMPFFFGTSIAPLIALIFAISVISQVTSPATKSAVALVTTAAEVAAVSAFISLFGSVGSAAGSTFVAPLLIKVANIRVLMYVAGAIMLIAAVRAYSLPGERNPEPLGARARRMFSAEHRLSLKRTARWMVSDPVITAMILVGALAVALFDTINALLPVYVRSVLKVDPALSIYVFAPAGIGFLAGTIAAPVLMRLIGERWLAVMGLAFLAGGTALFGAIDLVAGVVAPFSPLQLTRAFGVDLSNPVLAAGAIAIPANFGSTVAGAAVHAFVNRHVPIDHQGRTFGMQEVIEQVFTLLALLSLGAIGALAGSRAAFLAAPAVVLPAAVWLVRYSGRTVGAPAMSRREVARAVVTGRPTLPDEAAAGAGARDLGD